LSLDENLAGLAYRAEMLGQGRIHRRSDREINSEEKHEPASDIDTVVVDSLKALDPKRPIREADIILKRADA